jgi:hypothetical protein
MAAATEQATGSPSRLPKTAMGRQSMDPHRMMEVLNEQGWVECNSSKNRFLLYRLLEQQGKKWCTTIVGYTGQVRQLNPYIAGSRRHRKSHQSAWIYAKLIVNGRLLEKDVRSQAHVTASFLEKVLPAWTPGQTLDQVAQTLANALDEYRSYKYDPLNLACIHRPIKRVTLVRDDDVSGSESSPDKAADSSQAVAQ